VPRCASKDAVIPLFSGYCFTQPATGDWRPLLRTPGVLTLVKDGGTPARLDDGYVAALRCMMEIRDAEPEPVVDPSSTLVGDEVLVHDGPLAGFRGIVGEIRSRRKLVVWITSIRRGVAFTIRTAQVRSIVRPR
jgi:transcription antitermination factor NusG